MQLGLFWFIAVFFGSVCSQQQTIIESPKSLTVKLGESALLKCRVYNQKGKLFWLKDDMGLVGLDLDPSPYRNYKLEGSRFLGEYHLRIKNATLEDDAKFACQLLETNDTKAAISGPATVTVTVEPEMPKFVEWATVKHHVAGTSLKYDCSSNGGKPPAELAWALHDASRGKWIWLGNKELTSKMKMLSNQDIVRESAFTNETLKAVPAKELDGFFAGEQKENNKTAYNISSSINFAPLPEDDGTYLTCVVDHLLYKELQFVKVRLDIDYAPIVSLSVANNTKLVVGRSATFFCNATAKPAVSLPYKWSRKGKPLREKTNHLTIAKLTKNDNGDIIRCSVGNDINSTSASLKLDVSYGPTFLSTATESEVRLNDNVRFHCNADGNPEPEIEWRKAGSSEPLAVGKDWEFKMVSDWERGEYECIATVPDFLPIRQQHYLHLIGPPSIILTEDLQAAIGDTVELVCEIQNKPFPTNVTWTLNGRECSTKPVTVAPKYAVESRFLVNMTKSEQFGKYSCTASNPHGSASKTVEIKQRTLVLGIFPFYYLIPVLFIALSICIGVACCSIWRCRRTLYKNSARLNDEQSDVTVKCETLDGTQFFADMYTPPPLDGREIHFSKDYMSVPQNNPDMDYMQTPEYLSGYSPRSNHILDYPIEDHSRYDQSYGSFSMGASLSGDPITDMYGFSTMKMENTTLEPLAEVTTPDIITAPGLMVNGTKIIERPISRLSTHV